MELTLVRRDGTVLTSRCVVAENPFMRVRGLMLRSSLEPGEGLLLATSAIHTSFMRFPIDLVFLDRNLTVVGTVERLKPWRIAHQRGASSVVELQGGTVEASGIRIGEQLSLVKPGARPTREHAPSARAVGQVRVAVASADSRFLRVSRFLLARHSFQVDTYDDPATLFQAHPDVDVVVLDSSTSLSVTARAMRDLSVLRPTIGFVVVGDRLDPQTEVDGGPTSFRILPKWDSFDRLVTEIRLASPSEERHEFA